MKTRDELAEHIATRIADATSAAAFESSGPIRHVVVDALLPDADARAIDEAFPATADMLRKRSLREDKFVAAQMDRHDPLLEEIVFAFQRQPVLDVVSQITALPALEPDENLYAGGISTMARDQFLNPHLDNSHDKDRSRWRVLNFLYYVTRDWHEHDGGHLQLWPDGLRAQPITIPCVANRLVIMETHGGSWHSVTPIRTDRERRCVSNYFFSPVALRDEDRPHVTSFRNPNNVAKDVALRVDNGMRRLAKTLVGGRHENPHVYKR